jgi:arginase
MTVGGSCGTEAAPVSYLNSVYEGDLAVVWFDAHGDLNTPESSPSGHFHGMVLRTLLGDGPEIICSKIKRVLVSEQVFLAGARDLDDIEKEYIENSDIKNCEITKNLVNQISASGFSNVYIHIDVDVINPNDFSDALMPTEGGPTRKELIDCLFAITAQSNIVGVGLVEYCGRQAESLGQISKMLKEGGIIG